MSPIDKYNRRADKASSLLCVGLDSELEKLPAKFRKKKNPQFEFNKWIIAQTHEHVASYKLNIAFYEQRGDRGLRELKLTMDYLRKKHPDIFTICDAKRGDIGNTNRGYIDEIFDWLGFDAMTTHPYLGKESLMPILERADKVSIPQCRTSNPGSGDLQDLKVGKEPLWAIVARKVSREWNFNNNCMLVVGATYPREMKKIREIAGDMTFLVQGIGAQGGNVKDVVGAGIIGSSEGVSASGGKGLIIHSARGIIFSDNPGKAALDLKNEINRHIAKRFL